MELKTIKIKYVKDGMEKIEQIENGDWIDLRVAEDVHLEPNEFKLIPLGVAMALPSNHEALVIPRSSTFKKYGIIQANSIGLIDETYCGNNDEWKASVLALAHTNIRKGDRIAQFEIVPSSKATLWQKLKWLFTSGIKFVEVDDLGNEDRGGFGRGTGR